MTPERAEHAAIVFSIMGGVLVVWAGYRGVVWLWRIMDGLM